MSCMWTGLDGLTDFCDQNIMLPDCLEGSDLSKAKVFLMFLILTMCSMGAGCDTCEKARTVFSFQTMPCGPVPVHDSFKQADLKGLKDVLC